MANHARDNGGVADKRAALAGARQNAYSHSSQVGGTRLREADGRWVDRSEQERIEQEQRRLEANKPLSVGTFVKDNAVYILSAVAVAVIVLLLIAGVRMFGDLAGPLDAPQGEPGYESPYDWSKLDRTTDHYAYVVDGQVKSRLGVDVAEYEGEVDWNAVAADGIDFAMIRLGYRGATEGALYLDEFYQANLAGTRAAGVECGVYFFSQAVTVAEAAEEAQFVLDNLNGAPLEYPVAFDSETVSVEGGSRTADLTDEQLSQVAMAFCERIEQAGYRTLVYGNAGDLRSYDVDALTGRGIWWAEYGAESPSHYTDIVMWQYTSEGQVAGIAGGADMSIDLSGVLE